MHRIAVFLSYVLHPVFMLTWLIVFFTFSDNYFSYFMTFEKKIFLIGAVFVFSVVLPLLNTYLLKKFGYVKSVHMKESSERVMPYVSTLVLHLGLLYILHDLAIPFFFKYLIVTSILVLVVLMIFNFFAKISAHTATVGGCLGIICFYEFITYQPVLAPICICIVLGGLSGFSRLYLQAHTEKQVYAGFVTGLLTSILCLFLLMVSNYQF